MKVELHLLQSFPPSNLNRDDTGSPKECLFGGVRRARISSQSLKRSIRMSSAFAEALGQEIGIRTKRVPEAIAKRLVENHGMNPEEARVLAESFVRQALSLSDDGETKYLVYTGPRELEGIAGILKEVFPTAASAVQNVLETRMRAEAAGKDDKSAGKARADAEAELDKLLAKPAKDWVKSVQGKTSAVDIALFGRMLADDPTLNIDAACQVAHAISTNPVTMEFDYYTAVDDLNPEGETGAGMIGTTGFNANCFYRYAVIDADQLAQNLGGDRQGARDGIRAFLLAASEARPSGKQNTFAAHTPPSVYMGVVREKGMPMSLANAFEKAVRVSGETSLSAASLQRLDRHWGALHKMYPNGHSEAYLAYLDELGEIEHLRSNRVNSVQDVIDRIMERLDRWVAEGGA